MNHFFSADKIHNGYNFLPEGSVIETDDSGTVVNVHPPHTVPGEKVQQFEGIICPGFVNAHCHLELSHLKGALPEGGGLVPFLINIMQHRNNYTDAAKQEALHNAISESCENGIVAVGDIANTEDTLTVRGESKLHFHTFIECIGFTASFARKDLPTVPPFMKHFSSRYIQLTESSGNPSCHMRLIPFPNNCFH